MIRQHDRYSTKKRLVLWGVMLAFLLQIQAWSAMPVAAAAPDADDGWVVICTSDGFKRISLADAGMQSRSPTPGDTSHNTAPVLIDHCDLCVFAHGLGSAPALVAVFEDDIGVRVVRQRPVGQPVTGNSYFPQQPRAPPVLISV